MGVGAIIVDRDRVLLLKRRKEPESGCWGIQGGAVEFGETIEDAVRRELKEERSPDGVGIAELLGATDHILPRAGIQANVHWVSLVFLIRITSGAPRNAERDQRSDLRWFGLDSLPENVTLTRGEPWIS